jgi:hypothetical protein
MGTEIISNGSKFAGEPLDSLDLLKERLRTEPLDPMFEDYGCFAYAAEGKRGHTHFWGNFYLLSAVFDIITDDPDLCAELTALIKTNMDTVAYKDARREHLVYKRGRQEREAARIRRLHG